MRRLYATVEIYRDDGGGYFAVSKTIDLKYVYSTPLPGIPESWATVSALLTHVGEKLGEQVEREQKRVIAGSEGGEVP